MISLNSSSATITDSGPKVAASPKQYGALSIEQAKYLDGLVRDLNKDGSEEVTCACLAVHAPVCADVKDKLRTKYHELEKIQNHQVFYALKKLGFLYGRRKLGGLENVRESHLLLRI